MRLCNPYRTEPERALDMRVLRFFSTSHLSRPQQDIAQACQALSVQMYEMLNDTPHPAELAAGLRKLLEAKDCFVRASLGMEMVDTQERKDNMFVRSHRIDMEGG